MMPTLSRWVGRVVFWVAMLALTTALVVGYREAAGQLPRLGNVVLSASLLVAAVSAMAFGWAVIQGDGIHIDYAFAYVRSQVLKYLPLGGAAQAIAQVTYSKRAGASGATGSYIGYLAVVFGSASLLVGVGALVTAEVPSWLGLSLVGGVLVSRRLVAKAVGFAARTTRLPVRLDDLPDQVTMLQTSVLILVGFVLYGGSFGVLISGGHLVHAGVVALAAWLAGFIAVPLPSGIGAREAVLVALLAGSRNADVVLGLAVVHRWVSIVADLFVLMLVWGVRLVRLRCRGRTSYWG